MIIGTGLIHLLIGGKEGGSPVANGTGLWHTTV